MEAEPWVIFEDRWLSQGFAKIPTVVMRSPRLSMQAKAMYGLLLSYAWENGMVFPGQSRLCAETGSTPNTLRAWVKELVGVGLLKVTRRGQGKTNLYKFLSLDRFLSDTQSVAHQETQSVEFTDAQRVEPKEDSVEKDSVEKEKKESPLGDSKENAARVSSPRPPKAKKLTEYEAHASCLAFFGEHRHGSNVHEIIRVAAEENKTGEIAWTRAYREFVARFEKNQRLYPDITDEGWEYGFEQAISRGAGNIGYVTSAARGYKKPERERKQQEPKTPQSSLERLRVDSQLSRYVDVATRFDFTSEADPPWWVMKALGGDEDEQQRNLRRVRKTVGWLAPVKFETNERNYGLDRDGNAIQWLEDARGNMIEGTIEPMREMEEVATRNGGGG